jgi:hypothetical protein
LTILRVLYYFVLLTFVAAREVVADRARRRRAETATTR